MPRPGQPPPPDRSDPADGVTGADANDGAGDRSGSTLRSSTGSSDRRLDNVDTDESPDHANPMVTNSGSHWRSPLGHGGTHLKNEVLQRVRFSAVGEVQ